MALITCPECGKKISDKAEACIHCGYPLKNTAGIAKADNADSSLSLSGQPEDTPDKNDKAVACLDDGSPNTGDDSESTRKKAKRRKTIRNLGIALVALLAAGTALYVFYFQPRYVPKEVVQVPYVVKLYGVNTQCSFTGTMLNNRPEGSGHYVFSQNNDNWSYDGELDENQSFSAGTVQDMPVTLTSISGNVAALYSGAIQNGEIVDPIQVSDLPLKLDYEGSSYVGVYTGDVIDSLPEGYGAFHSSDHDVFFDYSGNWKGGQLAGEGTLYSNGVTVHFSYVDRKGIYNGEVLDGVFCGEGTFEASTDEGVNYTYSGEWKDGLWNGQGKLVYDSEKERMCVGTFRNGEFVPTVPEYVASFGLCEDYPYTPTEKASEFISKHSSLFTDNSKDGIEDFVDTEFSFAAFSKNPAKYGDYLFKISGLHVIQVFEFEDYWGMPMTHFLAYDGRVNLYNGIFLNQSDKIVDGRSITMYALPLYYSTYKGADNNSHWAMYFVAAFVE